MPVRALRCLLLLGVVATSGCPNPREQCEEICDWYLGYCDEDRDTCLDDCAWATPDQFADAVECIGSAPSSCRAASCCVEFAYDAYNYERECL